MWYVPLSCFLIVVIWQRYDKCWGSGSELICQIRIRSYCITKKVHLKDRESRKQCIFLKTLFVSFLRCLVSAGSGSGLAKYWSGFRTRICNTRCSFEDKKLENIWIHFNNQVYVLFFLVKYLVKSNWFSFFSPEKLFVMGSKHSSKIKSQVFVY